MIELTKKWIFCSLVLIVFCYTVAASPAYAYLDPGSQSCILQLLLGGALGSMVFLRAMWAKVIGYVTRPLAHLFRRDKPGTGPE